MAASKPVPSEAELRRRKELGERNFRHGMTDGPTYRSWKAMKARCLLKTHLAYHRYGGAGIDIYQPWMDFLNFLSDMGERPAGYTLERKDGSLGYSPSNCCWATRKQQGRNKKSSVFVTIGNETKCLSEWSEITGIGVTTLHYRYRHGLTGYDLINPDLSFGKFHSRKTHCPQGHEYTAENTYRNGKTRKCRICNKIRAKQLRDKQSAAGLQARLGGASLPQAGPAALNLTTHHYGTGKP